VFIILKQRIDSIKVETDVNIHNQEDIIGMENGEVYVPQECEPEVSHILRQFLWWWLLMFIFVCGFAHMELRRSVDMQSCCVSGALHLLQC
jgi:hypothetical protein